MTNPLDFTPRCAELMRKAAELVRFTAWKVNLTGDAAGEFTPDGVELRLKCQVTVGTDAEGPAGGVFGIGTLGGSPSPHFTGPTAWGVAAQVAQHHRLWRLAEELRRAGAGAAHA